MARADKLATIYSRRTNNTHFTIRTSMTINLVFLGKYPSLSNHDIGVLRFILNILILPTFIHYGIGVPSVSLFDFKASTLLV